MAEIIVYDFAELKSAITSDLYDNIILGSDISIGLGGIQIPSTTSLLTVDGKDPITGERHLITDYNSTSITDTIYINASSSIGRNITIKNMIINGRNYFGLVGVFDSANNSNVVLKFQNVDYSGVQPFYNRYGKCILENSDFLIDKLYSSVCPIGEVAESNKIELSENVNITSYSIASLTFWMTNFNPEFTVLKDAKVNIYTANRELFYNEYSLSFLMQENSEMQISCNLGMFYGSFYANMIKFEENSKFIFEQRTRNGSIPTIRCQNFIAMDNSFVIIRVNYSPSASLVQINANNGEISLNNPKRLVFYNYGNKTLEYSAGTGYFNVSAKMVNYWDKAADPLIAGKINDFPLKYWQKKDKSNVTISANVSASSTTNLITNITVPEDSDIPLDIANYPLHSASVLSYGILEATIKPIRDNSKTIAGNTEAFSEILITTESSNYLTTSDESMEFTQTLSETLSKNSDVSIMIANNFLYLFLEKKVLGSLGFLNVPEEMPFRDTMIPANKKLIFRKDPDWKIVIKDTREDASNWNLSAKITGSLKITGDEITDGLVFKDSDTRILELEPIIIFYGTGNQAIETITEISWEELKGVLVQIIPDKLYQEGIYQTEIIWLLIPDE